MSLISESLLSLILQSNIVVMIWLKGSFFIILAAVYVEIKDINKKQNLSTENVKKFKSDFFSIMQDIGGYIKYNDFEELKIFYKDIMKEYKDNSKIQLLNPEIINESAIYNIICNKYYLAKANGIDFELEIMMDFTKLKIKAYELARTLGILLDNAIEASMQCDNKHISVSCVCGKFKDTIIITNTFDNSRDIKIDKIFDKGYSTKSGNTGYGLWEINQILLKHSNLDLYTHKENNVFWQELYIFHK